MKLPLQIALATVVVAGCVAGLVVVGRSGQETSQVAQSGSPPEAKDSLPQKAPAVAPSGMDAVVSSGAADSPARALVPPSAWLIADFQGDLVGQLPFSDQPGLCAKVPAPARLAVAILPPARGTEPALLIAAPQVEDVFWGCARDRIVRAGGDSLAENDRYEVLKSPSGLVARGPRGSMVFLTDEAHLESALSTLSELSEGAASVGPHAPLYQRLHTKNAHSALDMTLVLPSDWLAQVGTEAAQTPLRFIHSAILSVHEDGSAAGSVDCQEIGCAEVLTFLERAKADLVSGLAPNVRAVIAESLQTKHLVGMGRISVTWSPSKLPLGSLLGTLLPSGF